VRTATRRSLQSTKTAFDETKIEAKCSGEVILTVFDMFNGDLVGLLFVGASNGVEGGMWLPGRLMTIGGLELPATPHRFLPHTASAPHQVHSPQPSFSFSHTQAGASYVLALPIPPPISPQTAPQSYGCGRHSLPTNVL
jgi:hypothetical protein